MDDEKYADIIRTMIMHETTLRNNRLTWMWTLHGLLATAYGVLWEKSLLALIVLTITGLLSSLSTFNGLFICGTAISKLKDLAPGDGPTGKIPPVIGHYTKVRLFLPWNFLPVWFAIIWIALLVIAVIGRS